MGTTLLAVVVASINHYVVPWVERILDGEPPIKKPFLKRIRGTAVVAVTTWILIYSSSVIYTTYADHKYWVGKSQELEAQTKLLTAELRDVKQENTALREKVPAESSLKSRALQTADELEHFFQKRQQHQPSCVQAPTMTPDEQRTVMQPCAKYNMDTMIEYQRFASVIMAIVQEFKGKGMNVQDIENCAPQGGCGIPIPMQLRAFAARLDAKDNVRR
jgi:hypothetical protein